MTNTVEQMLADLLTREGGFVNHPADKGGATNYGITQATLSNYLGRQCSVSDVKAMSKATAADIYEIQYFIKPQINKLPNVIQPLLFDMAVNHGCHNAIKMLQEELIDYGFNNIGKVDGQIGNLTIGATNAAIDYFCREFINQLCNRRLAFYHAIVKRDPSQKVFLNDWEKRAKSFYQ